MRIAIDARLNAYRQGGIPQYTRQLLTALAAAAPNEQFISLQHRDQLRPLVIAPNVQRRTALTPPHHRFEQWSLPVELLLARPSVLHSPDFIAPLRRPCPAVVTIHDLAFMHYPEILDDSARAYYGQVRTNAPRADGIIAVSEATRQDIAQFLDIPIEQIDVIYEAAAPLYQPIALREGEARVLNATPLAANTFLLFVSTLEPRKNLPTLLQALRICLDRRPDAGYRLVVVGRRGWRDDAIFDAVRDLKLADHVLFTGGVGQYDLRWLYNACRLYVNPSLYEGFGLPLLEAMACGAACLAAATSSLPEIGGDAAVYVPPLDADVWADEIEALWENDDRRAELSRLGRARAQRFSWARAARETLSVYRRAAERRLPSAETPALNGAAQLAEPAGALFALPSAGRSAPTPGGPRQCVRCGTELAPGPLQHRLAVRAADAAAGEQPPRLWACPSCGHVELVVDWPTLIKAAAPAQGAPKPLLAEVESASETFAPPLVEPDATQAQFEPAQAEAEPIDEIAPVLAEAEPIHVQAEPAEELAPALAEAEPIEEIAPAEELAPAHAEPAAEEAVVLQTEAEPDAAGEPPPHSNEAGASVELGAPLPAPSPNGAHGPASHEPLASAEPPGEEAPQPAAAAKPPAKRRQNRSKRKA